MLDRDQHVFGKHMADANIKLPHIRKNSVSDKPFQAFPKPPQRGKQGFLVVHGLLVFKKRLAESSENGQKTTRACAPFLFLFCCTMAHLDRSSAHGRIIRP